MLTQGYRAAANGATSEYIAGDTLIIPLNSLTIEYSVATKSGGDCTKTVSPDGNSGSTKDSSRCSN